MAYDKDKTAVLIMDYQREIVANYAGGDPEITTRAAAVLTAARAAGILVVHVIVAFRPGHPEIAPRGYFKAIKGAGRLVLGSPEAEIHSDVAPEWNDLIVTKKRVGAFAGSDLDMLPHVPTASSTSSSWASPPAASCSPPSASPPTWTSK